MLPLARTRRSRNSPTITPALPRNRSCRRSTCRDIRISHSASGLLTLSRGLWRSRPFRIPRHRSFNSTLRKNTVKRFWNHQAAMAGFSSMLWPLIRWRLGSGHRLVEAKAYTDGESVHWISEAEKVMKACGQCCWPIMADNCWLWSFQYGGVPRLLVPCFLTPFGQVVALPLVQ